LTGPPPATIVAPVPTTVMQQTGAGLLRQAVAAWLAAPSWDAWSQRYAVVSAPRMLRTALVGDAVSKSDAVHWAVRTLDPRWTLLQQALATRGQRPWNAPVDDITVTSTLDCLRAIERTPTTGSHDASHSGAYPT
jgi:hypothetical protein